MTKMTGRALLPEPPAVALRRNRARTRRAVALAGMLAAVGGLVGVRAALSPAPVQALGSSGLASPVHGGGSASAGAGKPQGSAPTGGTGARRRTVVGGAYDVGYGTVQVRVTLHGRRITGVTALQLPSGGRSSQISGYAAPRLRHEALAAQSAHIDTVSGASYTSAGYASSLQSALNRAGL
jgi:FMN-binding domain